MPRFIPHLLTGICLATPAVGAPITFDTQSDFTDNFFVTNTPVNWRSAGYVRGGGQSDTAAMAYDPTPDTTPTALFDGDYQIDFDLRFTSPSGEPFVGVYFRSDGTAARNSPLVLLREADGTDGSNPDGSDDQFIFRTAGSMNTANSGATALSGFAGQSFVDATFNHIRLLVEEVNAATQLKVTVQTWSTPDPIGTPDWSTDYTYSATDSAAFLGAGEVGFYFNPSPSGANIDIDNFEVSAVPEPASLGLLAIGAGLLLTKRRRQPHA